MIAMRHVKFGYGRTVALTCDTLDIGPGVTLLLGPACAVDSADDEYLTP